MSTKNAYSTTHEGSPFGISRIILKQAFKSAKDMGACHRDSAEDIAFCRLNGEAIKRFDSAWNTICRIAGFDDLNYHDLRHSFCASLILAGLDLKEVKEMIGRKDLASTDQ